MTSSAKPVLIGKSIPNCHSEERSDEESVFLPAPRRTRIARFARDDHTRCPLYGRALFGDQLLDLLHELRGRHVVGFLLASTADVHFAGFGFFVADD